MYKDLPNPLLSQFGFQGCLASLELNGDVVDPAKVCDNLHKHQEATTSLFLIHFLVVVLLLLLLF